MEVTAEFFSDDVLMRPGISVQGQIAVSDAATMISVPYEAILQDENNREYVYQLIDGNITKRYIQVEQELANYVQVVSGMEETPPVFLQSDSIVDSNNYHIVYREDWYE